MCFRQSRQGSRTVRWNSHHCRFLWRFANNDAMGHYALDALESFDRLATSWKSLTSGVSGLKAVMGTEVKGMLRELAEQANMIQKEMPREWGAPLPHPSPCF